MPRATRFCEEGSKEADYGSLKTMRLGFIEMVYRERRKKAPGAAAYTRIIIAANPARNKTMAWIIDWNYPVLDKGKQKEIRT